LTDEPHDADDYKRRANELPHQVGDVLNPTWGIPERNA
jgi:hypothetical protein